MNIGTKLEKESKTDWDIVPGAVIDDNRTVPLKVIILKIENNVNQSLRTR
jgi:hypothetical protein